MNKPTVAIVGIYKNEEHTLDRALSSVFDFVDAYFLAIDDSSTDRTFEIAEKWVRLKGRGKVIPFTWQEDFSAARNVAIEACDTEWWFTLDGHEYVEKESQTFLRSLWDRVLQVPNIAACAFKVKMGAEDSYTSAHQFRLMRNLPDIKYERPLHNQVVGITGDDRVTAYVPEISIVHDRHEDNKKIRDPQRESMIENKFITRLQTHPKDTQALFYVGSYYHGKGNLSKAEKYFKRYLKYSTIKYERGDVYHKLCDVYNRQQNQEKRTETAWKGISEIWDMSALWIHLGEISELSNDWFKSAFFYHTASAIKQPSCGIFLQEGYYTWIPWYKLAAALERLGQIDKAYGCAKQATQFADMPDNWRNELVAAMQTWEKRIQNMASKPRPKGLKVKHIAVFDNIGSFTPPLIEDWKRRGYEVEVRREFDPALGNWADVMWFEWCDQNLIAATKLDWESEIVCRLHGYESFAGYPEHVNWSRVNTLIFVSDHHARYTLDRYSNITCETVVIHNGVDLDKFYLNGNIPKNGNKIAYVGYLNSKKGSDQLPDIARKLPNYEIHVAGTCQEANLQEFLKENAPPNLHFHGWVDDVSSFLEGKTYILSPSINESFGFAIAEGMARGLTPLVRNRPGATDLWPEEFVYEDLDDLVQMVEVQTDPEENREWVAERYNRIDQLEKVSELIELLT